MNKHRKMYPKKKLNNSNAEGEHRKKNKGFFNKNIGNNNKRRKEENKHKKELKKH